MLICRFFFFQTPRHIYKRQFDASLMGSSRLLRETRRARGRYLKKNSPNSTLLRLPTCLTLPKMCYARSKQTASQTRRLTNTTQIQAVPQEWYIDYYVINQVLLNIITQHQPSTCTTNLLFVCAYKSEKPQKHTATQIRCHYQTLKEYSEGVLGVFHYQMRQFRNDKFLHADTRLRNSCLFEIRESHAVR